MVVVMSQGNVLQIIIIITGIFLLCVTTTSLARRKMTESFCITWGLISVMIILAGILLRPVGWSKYVSTLGMMLVLIVIFCVIYVAYFLSSKVSELSRKNQELAIQVSLLNQENERILERIEELTGVEKRKI